MRITSFWAKNYRSLRDVRLDGLGAFNVFYGKNGSGKSNVLAGLQTLCAAFENYGPSHPTAAGGRFRSPGKARDERLDAGLDLYVHAEEPTITLGATVLVESGELPAWPGLRSLDLVMTHHAPPNRSSESWVEVRPGDPPAPPGDPRYDAWMWAVCRYVETHVAGRGFGLIDAIRHLQTEPRAPTDSSHGDLRRLLDQGAWKRALFETSTSPVAETRRRFKAFQALLQGAPLHRKPFSPVRDHATGEYDLHEDLTEVQGEARDLPLERVGLGVAQLYTIVAKILFHGSSALGIEEPEAHLHAPTSGRHLRELLQRLVREGYLRQLFIATHSNLFDLDETGYWDVSNDDGETRIARKCLDEIDAWHLYEPGPAKHILQRMLRRYGDEVVFRTQSGQRMSAAEMLTALQEDNAVAVEFLRTLHTTALDTMAMRAQGEDPGEGP